MFGGFTETYGNFMDCF